MAIDSQQLAAKLADGIDKGVVDPAVWIKELQDAQNFNAEQIDANNNMISSEESHIIQSNMGISKMRQNQTDYQAKNDALNNANEVFSQIISYLNS